MSVEYDLYFVSKPLIDFGANGDLTNDDGSKALHGIDGGKVGHESWDNPVTMLKAVTTREELEVAFAAIEKAPPSIIAKDKLILAGTSKKKSPDTKDIWDH